MSDAYKIAMFGGAIILLLLVTIAFFSRPSHPSTLELNTNSDAHSADHSNEEHSENFISICLDAGLVEQVCEAVWQPSREPTQEDTDNNDPTALSVSEADLLAQERVAHWTLWGVVFGASGIGILVLTLAETRAVTIATRDIGQKQVRAYCDIAKLTVKFIGTDKLTATPVFKNTGMSPAVGFKWRLKIKASDVGEWQKADWQPPVGVSSGTPYIPIGIFFTYPKYDTPFILTIDIEIDYNDVFEENDGLTERWVCHVVPGETTGSIECARAFFPIENSGKDTKK